MTDKTYVSVLVGTTVSLVVAIYAMTVFLPEERYMDEEYPVWMSQKDHVFSDGTQQEILFLGDSRMQDDVIPLEMGDDVYNLALGGATPIEMYYSLKNYLYHHPKPKAVIVAFGPIHYYEASSYTGRSLYFHYLDDEEVDEINSLLLSLDGVDYRTESIRYKYRSPEIYAKSILKSVFHPRTEKNRELYQYTQEHKGRWKIKNPDYEMEIVNTQEAGSDEFQPSKTLTWYMEKIIEVCQSKDIPICIEQLPMGMPGHEKLYRSKFIDSYKCYMTYFAEKYGISVNLEIPRYENYFFRDDSHLNEKGARVFTQEMRRRYLNLMMQE